MEARLPERVKVAIVHDMNDLHQKHCQSCENATAPMTQPVIEAHMSHLHEWDVTEEHDAIYKTFTFKNFYETMAFANAVAWIANTENHHPDIELTYNTCSVIWYTHSVSGLSENDFICASKVDQLLGQ